MANVVGQLVIKLRADIAEFQSDMGKANQVATQTSAQIARQVRDDSKDARGSLMLLADDFGIHLPREIRKSLAEMDGFREVAAAAMGPVLLLGFASIIAEQVVPAIKQGAEELAGWGKAEQDAYAQLLTMNKAVIDANKKIQDIQRETALLGKTPVEQAQMKAQWSKQDADHAKQEQLTRQGTSQEMQRQLDLTKKSVDQLDAFGQGALLELVSKKLDIGPMSHIDEDTKKAADSMKEASDATNQYGIALANVALTQGQLAEAQKTADTERKAADAQRIADLDKQRQLLDETRQRLLQMQLLTAGDPDTAAKIKNQMALNALKVLSDRSGEAVLPDVVSAQFAKNSQEAATAWAALSFDANKAVAELDKANQAGLFGSLNLSVGTPRAPGFKEDPFGAQLSDLTAHTQKAAEEQGKLVDQMWLSTRTSAEQYAFELQKINLLYTDHSSDDYKRALVSINNQYDLNTIAEREFATQAGQTFQGLIAGTEGWKQALEGVLEQLVLLIPKLLLANEIQSMMGQKGATGVFGDFLGGLFGIPLPHRAGGGPVQAGMPYITSENGPELFIPSTSGTIVPNYALRGASGASGIVVHNDFRGVDAATIPYVEQRVAQGVRTAVQQSLAKGADQQRRR